MTVRVVARSAEDWNARWPNDRFPPPADVCSDGFRGADRPVTGGAGAPTSGPAPPAAPPSPRELPASRHASFAMLRSRMNPRVFWGASLIIGALLAVAVAAPGASDRVFQAAQARVIGAFGWFYIAAVAGFLLTVIALALAPPAGCGSGRTTPSRTSRGCRGSPCCSPRAWASA